MFFTSYDKKSFEIHKLSEIPSGIRYALDSKGSDENIILTYEKEEFALYKRRFDLVQRHIEAGDFYLANLTQKTKLTTDATLEEIYDAAACLFKLYKKGSFVCFTPERFVSIKNDKISTFPMKGTSKNDNDLRELLSDTKEYAEHLMSVDLLRNDLALVAKEVRVERFRYAERIRGSRGDFFQTSTKISGKLDKNWSANIGTILDTLLPAGSITGTPKRSVVDSLAHIEEGGRGYFCGVGGVYDGETLESFVLIRFVEQEWDTLYYKSGGGITALSDAKSEYEEVYKKIYVPIF